MKRSWIKDKVDARAGVIYALTDPRTGKIRYIGKANNPKKRFADHVQRSHPKDSRSHKTRWLVQLKRMGLIPGLRILQECLPGMMDHCEQEWIARGRKKGWKLCNINPGGGSGPLAEETRKRLSEISRARWQEDGYRSRWAKGMGIANLRRVTPEERKERESQRDRNRAINARNMQIAASRKRERESFATITYLTRGATAFVPLTQGKTALIDTADAERVAQYIWSASLKGRHWRAKSKIAGETGLLSRFIAQPTPAQHVAFRTDNTLDCRRSNLAIRTGHVRQVNQERCSQVVYLTRGDIAFVPLTKGRTAIIDRADIDRVKQHVWYATLKNGKWIAQRGLPDRRAGKRNQTLSAYLGGSREIVRRNAKAIDYRRCNLATLSPSAR